MLSDVDAAGSGLGRAAHGLAGKSRLRFARRVLEVGAELVFAELLDRLRPLRAEILAMEAGDAPRQGRSTGLYLHWSASGRVSAMVLRQLALWRAAGFDMVFVTNATPPREDWDAVAAETVLRIRRRNVGRDFGAWRDAATLACERLGTPEELLLANDSVLGPFQPLEPLIDAWRGGGEGLFGMTESWGGGPHLQSYALLARGQGAVAGLRTHLAQHRDSRSKWRTVQGGEIGLTRRMLAEEYRCAALFGYRRVCAALDAVDQAGFGPRFTDTAAVLRYPLNPTHHLWRVLVERHGFPYLKTELVRRNPGHLPGVDHWREVVPAPMRAMIEDHLAVMDAPASA
ncbi:hypothetical protein [Plastoroseomonas arctica]|uniref:Rhamnan synthesis protein F n=1 Tax=Plastoroseomonas arctica TaxID=1509237 RepID=A0AAF1KKI3_9PROT|nr:hypothetical protein [Plastoroseomonas arctica]MBR0653591.1 hypothetical protein [Plastoroseomonas arctica]